jgi:hypothetical protein
MEGLCGHCVGTYGGEDDLSAEQVGAHSSNMIDVVFASFRAKVGRHVVRLHHRFTKSA